MRNYIETYIDTCKECKIYRKSKAAQEPVFSLNVFSYPPGD